MCDSVIEDSKIKILHQDSTQPVSLTEEINAVINTIKIQWDCSSIHFKDTSRQDEDPIRTVVELVFETTIAANQQGFTYHRFGRMAHKLFQQRVDYLKNVLNVQPLAFYDGTGQFLMGLTTHVGRFHDDFYNNQFNFGNVLSSITEVCGNTLNGLELVKPHSYEDFLSWCERDEAEATKHSQNLTRVHVEKFDGHDIWGAAAPGLVENSSLDSIAFLCDYKGRATSEVFVSNIAFHAFKIAQYNNECALMQDVRKIVIDGPFSNEPIIEADGILKTVIDSTPDINSYLVRLTDEKILNILSDAKAFDDMSPEDKAKRVGENCKAIQNVLRKYIQR